MSRNRSKSGSSGRFGPRYGVRVRRRIADIEERQRADHDCPSCGANKVRRVSTGIWECGRCDHKFAGGAYVPHTKVTRLEAAIEESADEILEDFEETG